jgi:hypothetical protein
MSFGELERLVYSGNLEGLRNYLDALDDSPIITDYEPYTQIQKKRQAAALNMLMDDPRFVFDDRFVGRMFYFSTGLTHRVVWEHPKMKAILEGASSMSEYFYRRYPKPTWRQSAGIGQRYFQADNAIRCLRKEDTKRTNQRLAFGLYPRLVKYIRAWRQRVPTRVVVHT